MTGALPFYITTPIYYVNDVPHLGTAYTTIVADALRRYAVLRGRPTRMLTGTDEHGLKIERRAAEEGQSPQAFADGVSARFRETWPELRVEADDFIRTTEPRHIQFVQDLWKRIEDRGFLYLGSYDDWYCVGCESFKTEKELLPGNLCAIHLKPVERLKEETYFFKLSAFQDQLLALFEKRPELIRPESRANEVKSFVAGGLRDLSVSRTSFTWGIPVPGNDKHVMYVWFDALSNYLSALGGPDGEHGSFWPPKGEAVHLVGKDILRFHTVYWPAFLLAAGYAEDSLPTTVYAHGFLTVDGQKMSKSLRNAVDPRKLAAVLGADTLRYHLLRAIAFGQDGDFSHEAMLERYNADLGKNLGNLLSRTLGLCTKFFDGTMPAAGNDGELETQLAADIAVERERAREAWARHEPHQALEATFAISSLLNQYIDRAAPWASAKTDLPRAGHTLQTILHELAKLSLWLWPAMPDKADAMRAQLGLAPVAAQAGEDLFARADALPAGTVFVTGTPLFPTYDRERTEAILTELKPPAPKLETLPEEPPPTLRRDPEPPAAAEQA
ncbi:MAG: methionine--tRNA ligase, partial [Proteobacteria bacterium]